MIGFLIGLIVGGIFGVIVMALMNIASQADESAQLHSENKM
ncbi:MAG: DUF3789 domain-containing protein [Ruminococcus sp.]|nr:DUF3789 domain-containing protein [Ruminococcus sp.]